MEKQDCNSMWQNVDGFHENFGLAQGPPPSLFAPAQWCTQPLQKSAKTQQPSLLQVNMVTANVLSLVVKKDGQKDGEEVEGCMTFARAVALRKQCHDANLHVVGIH